MKFEAAILRNINRPLEIHTLEVPKLRYGQVLVKVLCSSICGSQIGEIHGVKGADPWLPHLLGHEGCGEVLECGEGVTTVKSGDRVVMHWRNGSGLQGPAPLYRTKTLGSVNGGFVTTFNELAVVSENRLTTINSDFNPEYAALMGCAITTSFGVINNNAKIKIGQSVVIWGCGGIGLSMVQAAALVSAYPIIAIDLFDTKLLLAKNFGATHTINPYSSDPIRSIVEIVGRAGADIAIDNTGQPKIIRSCYDVTNPNGKTILVGVPSKDCDTSFYTLPLHFNKSLLGSHGGNSIPNDDIPRYIRLIDKKILNIEKLITNHYAFHDIDFAVKEFQNGQIPGKCIVHIS